MTLNFEILDYPTNRYTVKKTVYSKSIQNVRRWVLVGYMAGNHGKSWMRSNGKFGIWYVKIPLFMTFTDIFKNGLWQCMVCSSLTRGFLLSCDGLHFSQYKHHLCLCSFQVFTNLIRRCERGGDWPPI